MAQSLSPHLMDQIDAESVTGHSEGIGWLGSFHRRYMWGGSNYDT